MELNLAVTKELKSLVSMLVKMVFHQMQSGCAEKNLRGVYRDRSAKILFIDKWLPQFEGKKISLISLVVNELQSYCDSQQRNCFYVSENGFPPNAEWVRRKKSEGRLQGQEC